LNGSSDIGAGFNLVRDNPPLVAVGGQCAAATRAEYSDSLQAGYDTQGFRSISKLWKTHKYNTCEKERLHRICLWLESRELVKQQVIARLVTMGSTVAHQHPHQNPHQRLVRFTLELEDT